MTERSSLSTEIASVVLSPIERESFEQGLGKVQGNPYKSFESFFGQVRECRRALPVRLREALEALRAGHGPGALLARNLPIPSNLPATPGQPFPSLLDAGPLGTEAVLASAIDVLGEPFSYEQWDSGQLVHNKYPIHAHRTVQFGSNAVEFLLHTETPFRDVSPDYLALLCLRGDPTGQAKTRVADIARVVAGLSSEALAALAEPSYAFATDNPVIMVDGQGLTEPQPIISYRDGARVIEYVGDLIAITAPAQRALAELSRLVLVSAVDVPLVRGDLLVLDNMRVVHGRNAITPSYDGTDRWLQRMLVTTRLLSGRAAGSGRLVSDRRYANYPTDYQKVLRQAVN